MTGMVKASYHLKKWTSLIYADNKYRRDEIKQLHRTDKDFYCLCEICCPERYVHLLMLNICLGLWRGEKDLHLVFLFWKSKLSTEMTIDKLKTHISYWNNDTKYQTWASSLVFFLSVFKDARMCLYPNQITDPTSTWPVYQLNNWLPFLCLSYLKWFASCICKNMDGPWGH